MKKLLALLFALLMVGTLAACGSDKTPEPAPEEEKTTEQPETTEPNNGDKVLRVAMECGYAPYNWTQPDDANGAVPISGGNSYAYGYDVMMAKLIAEELGYELEIVKTDWESIIPAIQAGTVDAAICGQSITADRLEMVDFTEPYYYASIVALVAEDGEFADATSVADLAGAKCVSQMNTVWYDVCLPQIPDADILPGAESAPAMVVALTSGSVNLVVTDQPTAMAAVSANPGLKMIPFEGDNAFEVSDEEINIGISLMKGNTELKDAINGVLANLTEEDFTRMMNDAIAVQPFGE